MANRDDFSSNKAFKAYEEAERRIAAWEKGVLGLSIDQLDRLPPEISGLTGLTRLYLTGTGVSDISALSGLTGLMVLDLSGTGVSDISALSGLTGLMVLDLSNTGVSDISALSGLTGLTELYLSRTGVSDISALSGLTRLTDLYLSGTGVSDISALSVLTGLTDLYLSRTGVSDISALSGLTRLTDLDLSGTGVSDLSALSGLTGLTRLDLSDTGVSDLSALVNLRQMAEMTQDQAFKWGRWHGVHLFACPNLSKPLREIAKIEDDRERTLQTLNHIRAEAGLSSVEEWVKEPWPPEEPARPATPDHRRNEELHANVQSFLEEVQERVAIRFQDKGEHIGLQLPEAESDESVSNEAVAQGLFAQMRRQLEGLYNDTHEIGNIPCFRGMGDTYDELNKVTDCALADLPGRLGSLWALLGELGSFLELDDDIKLKQAEGMPMDGAARRKLNTLINAAATLLRQFPTGRALDDDMTAYRVPADRYGATLELTKLASSKDVFSAEDKRILKELVDAIERGGDGVQSQKLKNLFVKSGPNFTTKIMGFVGNILLSGTMAVAGPQMVLFQKLAPVVIEAEAAIIETLADSPADIRLAAQNIINDLRKQQDAPSPDSGSKFAQLRREEDDG